MMKPSRHRVNPLGVLRKLHRDEGAVGLLFGALTLFILVAVVAMSANVWELLRAKVQIQNAADAVAYSAAALAANTLAALASLNGTLIWIYRVALGIIAAVVTTGILAALNVVLPGAFAWAIPLFKDSLSIAQQWLPRLIQWARRVAALQDQIVKGVPALVEVQALRIARANGASAGFVLPVIRLPVERERNLGRFLDRVGGGVVPGWALKYLFPEEVSAANRSDRFSASGSRTVHVPGRRGRSSSRTESHTRTEEDFGSGARDAATRGMLDRFRKILAEVRGKPLPRPLVLTGAYARLQMQAVVWKDAKPIRSRVVLGEKAFPWPSAARGFLALAAAAPAHPRIDMRTLSIDADNLYRTEGWEVVWRPVDPKKLRGAKGPAATLLRKFGGLDKLGDLIQH